MTFRKLRIPLLRVLFGCFVLLALFFGPSARMGLLAGYACRWAGDLLLMAGLGLRMWAILYVGQKKSHELIKTGPYSLNRNPLYLGTFLLTLGAAIRFENFAMCLFALALVIPIHIAVVLAEEKHLRVIFGDEYAQYCQQTPRFLFRLSGYNSSPTINVSIKAVRRAMVDGLGVMMIPPLASLVDLLRTHGISPILWQWP